MVTKTIGTTSRDFSTVAAWIVYLEALTYVDDEIGEMYNDSIFGITAAIDFIDANIDQSTFSTILRAAPGESFNDHANKLTNALWANQSNGVLIERTSGTSDMFVSDLSKFEIEGLQIVKDTGYGDVIKWMTTASAGDKVVAGCIVQHNGTGTGRVARLRDTDIISSLLVCDSGSSSTCLLSDYGTGVNIDGSALVRTETAGSTTALLEAGSGVITMRNSAAFGFNTLDTNNVTGDFNASDLAIGFGSNNQASKTYADQFEDITNNAAWESSTADFTPKTTGALNGNGDSATLPTLDILEQTRSGDYIGARDIVAGAPTGNPWNYYAQQAA